MKWKLGETRAKGTLVSKTQKPKEASSTNKADVSPMTRKTTKCLRLVGLWFRQAAHRKTHTS